MPRTITTQTTVYTFAELSDSAKEEAVSQYRENGLSYEWWDSVYEDAKGIAEIFGFHAMSISFSGFWSQGDGASFTANYRLQENAGKAIREYAPQDEVLHALGDRLDAMQASAPYPVQGKIERPRQDYAHDATMHAEGSYEAGDLYEDDDDEMDEEWEATMGSIESELQDIARAFARWIYPTLQREYVYLTSAESVEEMSDANNWQYTEDGKFYAA